MKQTLPQPTNWSYVGEVYKYGKLAYEWRYVEQREEHEEEQRYYFEVVNGKPIYLELKTVDKARNIQYDDYQIEFTHFEPGTPTGSVFAVPEECMDGKAIDVDGPPSVSMNMRSIIPRVQSGIEQT